METSSRRRRGLKPAALRLLIQEGESSRLEFKESLPGSLARDLVAMANARGGHILLGVRDDGSLVGVKDSNALRARVQDIAHNCDPSVAVSVEAVGGVLVIEVGESDAKPVQCSEGFFLRQGAVTQKLGREEIRDFFRAEGAIRFDTSPCSRFRFPQDFDRGKYLAWLRLAGIGGRPRAEDVLVNIEAAERDGARLRFTNAGVLFFAKQPCRFFDHAYITCLLAKGTDKVHILDRKDFDGGLAGDIEDALRFVERNTRLAYRIESLRRENIPEYPMKALREAITNAVMHRDWFFAGANVFVEIYADRIEVVSPGGLPRGMTLAALGHKSVRRNALIADLLHRIGFIEKAGTGIRRIREEARAGGYPEPVWETNGFTTAVFRPNPAVRAAVDLSGPSRDQVGTKWAPSQDQAGILRMCREAQPLTALLEAAGRSNRSKFRSQVLAPLVAGGLLELTIPDKPRSSKQRYRLTEAGRALLTGEEADHLREQ